MRDRTALVIRFCEDVVEMMDVHLLSLSCTAPSPPSDASPGTYVREDVTCSLALDGGYPCEGLVYHTRGCRLSVFHHFIRDGQCPDVDGDEV